MEPNRDSTESKEPHRKAGDKTGDVSLRQNSMITLSTFPGAIKSMEQKIGTFGPQTESWV